MSSVAMLVSVGMAMYVNPAEEGEELVGLRSAMSTSLLTLRRLWLKHTLVNQVHSTLNIAMDIVHQTIANITLYIGNNNWEGEGMAVH